MVSCGRSDFVDMIRRWPSEHQDVHAYKTCGRCASRTQTAPTPVPGPNGTDGDYVGVQRLSTTLASLGQSISQEKMMLGCG
jgi:hypothetical protein